MRCGFISRDDASFRAVCMLLAQHAQYANLPLRRAPEILRAVQLGQVFGAVDGSDLIGVVSWKETSDHVAREAVARRQLPPSSACLPHGDALVATAFLARSNEAGRLLWEAFLKAHQGRTILYERHKLKTHSLPVFKWMDKAGRLMGRDI